MIFGSIAHLSFSQNLTFSSPELKTMLLTEKTVDLNGDEIADTTIDLNQDNEIQVAEALAIQSLVLSPIDSTITNVTDLHQFENLKRLTITGGISNLKDISNLQLDSLVFIRISDIKDIDNINLSDLPNLKSIILESLYRLKNLNLKNGSYATDKFSLFYTDFIEYSCVDSIAAEYDIVVQHTKGTITTECSVGIPQEESKEISFYPNPATSIINIITPHKKNRIEIRDMLGRQVLLYEEWSNNTIDISKLGSGAYVLIISSGNEAPKSYPLIKS